MERLGTTIPLSVVSRQSACNVISLCGQDINEDKSTKKARFEPSSRLIRQLQRENNSKQDLEHIFAYPRKVSFNIFENEAFREVRSGEKALVDGEVHTPKCSESRHHIHHSDNVPKLVMKFHSIEFYNHYFFNEEERLTRKLYQAVEKFTLVKDSGRIEYFCSRLSALMNCMDAYATKGVTNLDMQRLFREIQTTVDDLVFSENDIHSSYTTVISTWNELSSLRVNQGFQSTTLMLQISTERKLEDTDTLQILTDSMLILDSKSNFLLESLSDHIKSDYEEDLLGILSKGNMIILTKKQRKVIQLIDSDAKYFSSIVQYPEEQKRRSYVQSERYFIRVMLNGHFVHQTKPTHIIWPSWKLPIDDEVNCFLSRIPDSISIQLYRHNFLVRSELLFETFVQCPGKELSAFDNRLTMLAPTTLALPFTGNLQSKSVDGIIHSTIYWVESTMLNSEANCVDVGVPPRQVQRLIGKTNGISSEGSSFMYTSSNCMESSKTSPLLTKYAFAFLLKNTNHLYMNSSRFQAPLRHQMIRMRSQNFDQQMDSIPLTECDIPKELRLQVIRNLENFPSNENSIIAKASEERPAVPLTTLHTFVSQVVLLRKHSDRPLGPQQFEDIVYDKSYIRSLMPPRDYGLLLESLFFRSFNAFNNKHREQTSPRFHGGGKLILTAVKVTNLPSRRRANEHNRSLLCISSSPIIHGDTRQVNRISCNVDMTETRESDSQPCDILLRYCFEGTKYETRTWKKQLDIPLGMNLFGGNISPSTLRSSLKNMHIILFDLVDVYVRHKKVLNEGDTDILKEKRFLGFAEIPLFALHENHKYVRSGPVILSSPPMLFGYQKLRADQENVICKTDEEEACCSSEYHPSPSLEIEILSQPQINSLDQPIAHTSSIIEVQSLMEYSHKWLANFHRKNYFSVRRKIDLFVRNSSNQSFILTQYFRPQNPPPEFNSRFQVAHYVSLIPFLRTWGTFRSDAKDLMWMTSQQVLDVSAGDWEAKGMLLANYFLSLENNNKVFVVFGTSFSEGKVVYVMTTSKNPEEMIFWNPVNGKFYSEDDLHESPLINIDYIVSQNNIYGNIQAVGKPTNVTFNVEDDSAWMPFFDPKKNPFVQLKSVQEETLVYSKMNIEFSLQLELDIKEKVKASIRSWRAVPSKFNDDISGRLEGILADLETRKCNGSCYESSSYYFRTISDLCIDKEVFGFPLHFAFTNVDEITERVHLSAIHESKHPNVEFALSVKVFPYVSNLYSVWIFLCTIMPK